jgi:hypothetical protein
MAESSSTSSATRRRIGFNAQNSNDPEIGGISMSEVVRLCQMAEVMKRRGINMKEVTSRLRKARRIAMSGIREGAAKNEA